MVPDAWVRLLRVYATATAELNGRMSARHGLSLSAYEVLLFLSWAPGESMRPSDLARRVLLTQSGVTRLLTELEHRNLVKRTRAEHDRRSVLATLTKEGLRVLQDAATDHVADVHELFSSHLDAVELEHLADLLGRVPGGNVSATHPHPVHPEPRR
jgi:DNA-binding MarR family transcriptional regulator